MVKASDLLNSNFFSDDIPSFEVRTTFLFCLVAYGQARKVEDQRFWNILDYYIEVSFMAEYLNHNIRNNYIIMKSSDIKFLLSNVSDIHVWSAALIESDIRAEDLEMGYASTKEKYEKQKASEKKYRKQ